MQQEERKKMPSDEVGETDKFFFPFFSGYMAERLRNQQLPEILHTLPIRPGETIRPDDNLDLLIYFLTKGSCTLHASENSTLLQESETMLVFSHTPHTLEAGAQGATLLLFDFASDLFKPFFLCETNNSGLLSQLAETNNLLKIGNHAGIAHTIQRLTDEMRQKKDPFSKYLIATYYAELFIYLLRCIRESSIPCETNIFLKKAIRYIQTNYRNPVTIAGIAQYVHISERYLRKLFDASLGVSPLEYLNQLRIKKALILIRSSEYTIKEVCFMCGFRSPQYFSRIFKQHTGMTPGEAAR